MNRFSRLIQIFVIVEQTALYSTTTKQGQILSIVCTKIVSPFEKKGKITGFLIQVAEFLTHFFSDRREIVNAIVCDQETI